MTSESVKSKLEDTSNPDSIEYLKNEVKYANLLYKLSTSPYFNGINYSIEHILSILLKELNFDIAHWYYKTEVYPSEYKCGEEWIYSEENNDSFKLFKAESSKIVLSTDDNSLFNFDGKPEVKVLHHFINIPFSRIQSKSITQFQTAIFVSFGLNNETHGFLEFFSKENKLVDDQMNLFFQNVSLEISRQLQILKNQESEKQQVFQMAQDSRLSSLGAMAGGIAHEINNPLTIIMGSIKFAVRFMQSDIKNPDQVRKIIASLDKAKSHTERIVKIVKGIRAMSRDGSNEPFVFAKTKDILEDTLNLCESRIKTNNIQLTFEMDDEELLVQCRPIQISQILLNLVNNSLDAIGDSKEPWIHIRTEKVSEDFVEFSVTDCGLGIPEQVANQLMQPFFTTKGAGRGTGLGLSISKEIVKSHEGEFYLNKNFKNTQFIVKLPIIQKVEK